MVCLGEDRVYYALPPAAWDGESTLPAAVFAHGYRSSATGYVNNGDVVQAFSDAGVLLLLPEAENGVWAVNAGGDYSSDIDYLVAMLEHAEERWPMDPARRVLGGYSIGASFAYVGGCERPDLFSGLNPVAGGFWEPIPETCLGPISVNHEHGSADQTWPLEGRPIGSDAVQGGAQESFQRMLEASGCDTAVTTSETVDNLSCTVYSSCESGKILRFCLHENGHSREPGWPERLIAFGGL